MASHQSHDQEKNHRIQLSDKSTDSLFVSKPHDPTYQYPLSKSGLYYDDSKMVDQDLSKHHLSNQSRKNYFISTPSDSGCNNHTIIQEHNDNHQLTLNAIVQDNIDNSLAFEQQHTVASNDPNHTSSSWPITSSILLPINTPKPDELSHQNNNIAIPNHPQKFSTSESRPRDFCSPQSTLGELFHVEKMPDIEGKKRFHSVETPNHSSSHPSSNISQQIPSATPPYSALYQDMDISSRSSRNDSLDQDRSLLERWSEQSAPIQSSATTQQQQKSLLGLSLAKLPQHGPQTTRQVDYSSSEMDIFTPPVPSHLLGVQNHSTNLPSQNHKAHISPNPGDSVSTAVPHHHKTEQHEFEKSRHADLIQSKYHHETPLLFNPQPIGSSLLSSSERKLSRAKQLDPLAFAEKLRSRAASHEKHVNQPPMEVFDQKIISKEHTNNHQQQDKYLTRAATSIARVHSSSDETNSSNSFSEYLYSTSPRQQHAMDKMHNTKISTTTTTRSKDKNQHYPTLDDHSIYSDTSMQHTQDGGTQSTESQGGETHRHHHRHHHRHRTKLHPEEASYQRSRITSADQQDESLHHRHHQHKNGTNGASKLHKSSHRQNHREDDISLNVEKTGSKSSSKRSNEKNTSSRLLPRARFERGRVHRFRVSNCEFITDARYKPLKPLGKGSYGVVCSARDLDTDTDVAIKQIPCAFRDIVDARRMLRETQLLHAFNHPHIIGLFDILDPSSYPINDVYMVMELMETDLHRIIYSQNSLTEDHIRYFMYQSLRGVHYMHCHGVIHRDLKPSNLLLNHDCLLKICDFGLARIIGERHVTNELTEYVVTRWYRAPEVMFSLHLYDYAVDVWSMGCIMAELFNRKPLFAGEDYIHQLLLIFETLGTPTEEDLTAITNVRALNYIQSLPHQNAQPWEQIVPGASPQAIDLLKQLLTIDPRRRISVRQALEHPFFASLHAQYPPLESAEDEDDFDVAGGVRATVTTAGMDNSRNDPLSAPPRRHQRILSLQNTDNINDMNEMRRCFVSLIRCYRPWVKQHY